MCFVGLRFRRGGDIEPRELLQLPDGGGTFAGLAECCEVIEANEDLGGRLHLGEVDGSAPFSRVPSAHGARTRGKRGDAVDVVASQRRKTCIEPLRGGGCAVQANVRRQHACETAGEILRLLEAALLEGGRGDIRVGHLPIGVDSRIGAAGDGELDGVTGHQGELVFQNPRHCA